MHNFYERQQYIASDVENTGRINIWTQMTEAEDWSWSIKLRICTLLPSGGIKSVNMGKPKYAAHIVRMGKQDIRLEV
jgi:hypothetical protein